MKKFSFAAVVLVAAATLVGCGNSAPKANLKNDIDTLSYAKGMVYTQGLREYLVRRLAVDTTYMEQFLKGLNVGVNTGDDKKKAAYYAGIQIGQQISNQMIPGINYEIYGDDSTRTISTRNFVAGFITGATGKPGLMDPMEAQIKAQEKMRVIQQEVVMQQYGENKAAGEKFLAENAKKPGVKTLPSGLQYKVITEGKGVIPVDTNKVTVNYEGRLINDTVFDSSYRRGKPSEFRVNHVIKGWTEALTMMPAGSVWEVYVPQDLAYGERKANKVDPFSTLIFKIELLEVK